MSVKYEWTIEELEDGEVIDSDFRDKLLEFNFNHFTTGIDLGLVRNEGNDIDGLTNRLWAYVKDGKLPDYFQDAYLQTTSIKIPARFHKELQDYQLSIIFK